MAKRISAKESKILDLLKFTLVFLIIFVHMNPTTVSLENADFPLFSHHGVSNALAIGISYALAQVAVLVYFLISGYLFGIGIEDWSWNVYFKKLKSRSRSLLLPYILWNLISISSFVALLLFNVIKNEAPLSEVTDYLKGIGLSGFWDYCVWGTHKINWLGLSIPNTGPFVMSLWFVRDLIVAVLCVPVLYFFLKKTRIWGLLILSFCFFSKIWPQIHGFSIDAIFFFGLGLFISINSKSLVEEADKIKIPSLIITVISFFFLLYYGGVKTQEGRFIFPIFALGCIWLYIKTAELSVSNKTFEIPALFVKSSFFVYLLHACPLAKIGSFISLINTIILNFVNHISAPWLVYYFISPFLIAGFCILVYFLLLKISPNICRVLSGDRIPINQPKIITSISSQHTFQ